MTWRIAPAITVALVVAACAGHGAIDVGPVPAGVEVDARVQYYEVSAATLAELRRDMVRLGPRWEGRSYQAVTTSRFKWEYQSTPAGAQRCTPSRVRVTVHTVVMFPRWNPLAELDSAMMEWWQQLNAGLMEHERGHASLSVKTAGEIARALEGMAPVPCNDLAGEVNAAGQRRIQLERRKQAEYDQATAHGSTQIERIVRLRSP